MLQSVDDQQPLAVGGGLIEWVDLFLYLGSVIVDGGSIDVEIDKRIANASKAFGALGQSVFDDPSKLRDVYARLVYYQPFCMEANVGHLSVAT